MDMLSGEAYPDRHPKLAGMSMVSISMAEYGDFTAS
jgi:hypothetical protein